MKFTYNWLKDFVPLTLKPAVLADKLTMAGLEVKDVEERDGDSVFEVEITSNRPDWLSIAGIAREAAALTGAPFSLPKTMRIPLRPVRPRGKSGVRISVAEKRDCPLYMAKCITGVRVSASPSWLSRRLELIGCRSVNNVVDVTNYVLHALGEPLHAFDRDRLCGELISVRRGRPGETLTTIDGVERALDQGLLVIADERHPVALAGIMGGKDTEVTQRTASILLEAAVFDPVAIRRGVKACGLSSDSSYRFERGVDPVTALNASAVAASMICAVAGGELQGAVGTAFTVPRQRRVVVSLSGLRAMLGVKVTAGQVKKLLAPLGFSSFRQSAEAFSLAVPSWRRDVAVAADVIEETARIYGYERIPSALAPIRPSVPGVSLRDRLSQLKRIVAGLGYNEVITYSLVDETSASCRFAAGGITAGLEPVRLMNPLTSEQGVLRPSLIPSLVRCIGHNFNQKQTDAAVFELAKTFGRGRAVVERYMLGIAASGERLQLLENGAVREQLGLFQVKAAVEQLCAVLGLGECVIAPGAEPGSAAVSVSGEAIGVIVRVGEEVAGRFDIKNREVAAAELDAEKLVALAAAGSKKFESLPRFPAIVRDVSFIKPSSTAFSDIRVSLLVAGRPYLRDVRVIDYYRGTGIPQNCRSITLSLQYRAEDRTLTDAELEPVHGRVLDSLKTHPGVALR